MKSFRLMVTLGLLAANAAQAQEGVLARCGASSGHAYFFRDDFWNPEGPSWEEDGMSNGQIILVRLGEEWDIQFGDAIGSGSYRQDGAMVLPLTSSENYLMIGAFHANYSDIYTFSFADREVAWTSSKIGPLAPRTAAFRASCG